MHTRDTELYFRKKIWNIHEFVIFVPFKWILSGDSFPTSIRYGFLEESHFKTNGN